MTSAPIATPIAHPGPGDRRGPRLSVKSAGSGLTGHVDGAWWPHSRDLVGELDVLLPAVVGRLGLVERVIYRLAEWDPVGRRADIGGTPIRLAGFHSQAAHTVDVLAEQHRVTLLVIPPDTPPGVASSVLETAGTDGDASSIDELLPPAVPAR